ncbi:MAG TPA: hypothetical protein PKC43_10440 [Phycisphaerales bacterium]|nr:hypothetical protein [Phycisphaerales bacterium]HMP37853.1 hypothetical protein [Phycisphaerales bacterium]
MTPSPSTFRPLASLLLGAALLTMPAALVGCDSASKIDIPASASPNDLMSGYLGKLGDLNGLLSGVGSTGDAAAALPKAKDLVSGMGAYAERLTGLPTAQLDGVLQQFGPQLDSLTGALDSQVARLSQSSYGSTLASALKSVPRLR